MAVNKPIGDNAQGRGEEALAAEDHARRCEHMDQAQQGVRRVHGSEKTSQKENGREEVQGRADRKEPHKLTSPAARVRAAIFNLVAKRVW